MLTTKPCCTENPREDLRGMLYGFSAGMKSKPLVMVRDPLDDTNEGKVLTTIENPEKPGELIWVEYTGEVTEEEREKNRIRRRKSATKEELKELDAREAIHRKLSTRGTKSDKWICLICSQVDDHWPPKCPNKEDSPTSKRDWAEFQARASKAQEQPKDSVRDIDALFQASKGSGGQIYTHWQCRICGEIDDHWPRRCPFRYLDPFFAEVCSDHASATGKTCIHRTKFRGYPLFCGICGSRVHGPENCGYRKYLKLFTGTPPPVKTITPPKRKISWSTDFLVLPEPLHIPEYQPEMMPRCEEDDFFASPEEMIHYIKEINNKSSKASGSMADKPVVVGGAWTPPPRPLEYCRICCKQVKHSCLRCPYLLTVPPGTSVGPGYQVSCYFCGKENCYKHPKSNFARRISSPSRDKGPFKRSQGSVVEGLIYNPKKRCYQEIVKEVSGPFTGVIFKPGQMCYEIEEGVSFPEKRLQKPSFDQIEAMQQDNAFSRYLHFI